MADILGYDQQKLLDTAKEHKITRFEKALEEKYQKAIGLYRIEKKVKKMTQEKEITNNEVINLATNCLQKYADEMHWKSPDEAIIDITEIYECIIYAYSDAKRSEIPLETDR